MLTLLALTALACEPVDLEFHEMLDDQATGVPTDTHLAVRIEAYDVVDVYAHLDVEVLDAGGQPVGNTATLYPIATDWSSGQQSGWVVARPDQPLLIGTSHELRVTWRGEASPRWSGWLTTGAGPAGVPDVTASTLSLDVSDLIEADSECAQGNFHVVHATVSLRVPPGESFLVALWPASASTGEPLNTQPWAIQGWEAGTSSGTISFELPEDTTGATRCFVAVTETASGQVGPASAIACDTYVPTGGCNCSSATGQGLAMLMLPLLALWSRRRRLS